MKKIRITESQFKTITKKMLFEATNALSYSSFKSDMKGMGFVSKPAKKGEIFYIPSYGDKSMITVHPVHSEGKHGVKADTLRNIKNMLEDIGWFNVPGNKEKFPFSRWEFNDNINVDTTQQDIEAANEKYAGAKVSHIFQDIDAVCLLQDAHGLCNLCRNESDRRPLLDKWYNFLYVDGKPCLAYDNEELIQTEVYPIKLDGTLDTDNAVITESKTFKKK